MPNDPMANRQWGLRAVHWFGLDKLPDARKVPVAVLDTGVDATHPDVRVSTYHHEGASAEDIVGHGTHVTGIICAAADNKVGMTGICSCHLSVWKIFGDKPASDGEYYVDELMYQRALNAARNAGTRVVNLSISGTTFTKTEELLIRRLISSGCVVVAAMGNEYQRGNPIEYPGAYDGVIAIGAITEANRRASFSNTGAHIGLCAPGTNILSTLPMKASAYRTKDETAYAAWSGTSMATPHVAAAAALLLSKKPELTPAQVGKRLEETAARLPAMAAKVKRTKAFGYGLLDLVAALS
jgi:subtilisin family serine protease